MGPRVFISYSHDSDEHKQRVREQVTCLRKAGVDARLDQYEVPAPPDGWPQWSARQVVQSHFTFVICTENYCRRFEGLEEAGKGLGVRWESRIIQNVLFYETGALSIGFITLLFGSEDWSLVPTALPRQTMVALTEQGLDTATPEFVQILPMVGHQGGEALPIPTTVQAFDTETDTDYFGPVIDRNLLAQAAAFNAMIHSRTLGKWEQLEHWAKKVLQQGLASLKLDPDLFSFMIEHALHVNAENEYTFSEAHFYLWGLVNYWPGFIMEIEEKHIPLILVAQQFEQSDWQSLLEPEVAAWEEFQSLVSDLQNSENPFPEQLERLRPLRRFLPDRGAELFGPGKDPP
ncbi:hypothetical protein Pan153_24120 [Gimesia panareensis]|uniref:SEFIR domain-containing protein n=1 Tax=Gimesia panareensis TaxID=2527978 RepID=A0A518FN59_9PLAN|nr:toll/interleukin-1 receptor domain-containing protein [Gimesia panareensis]QDV17757.1 hypothetical protein Pan153_24120 [Gimesia panareensis]